VSKYNNTKCEYPFQGEIYKFDSKLERSHAITLFDRLKRGEIERLTLQKEFTLCSSLTYRTNSTKSGKTKQRAIVYISDFSYYEEGKHIVVDSKGFKDKTYSVKKKLFLSQLKEHKVDEFKELYKSESITYKELT